MKDITVTDPGLIQGIKDQPWFAGPFNAVIRFFYRFRTKISLHINSPKHLIWVNTRQFSLNFRYFYQLKFLTTKRQSGVITTLSPFTAALLSPLGNLPKLEGNIDVAFVCMNLPFTMDAKAAASAVAEFAPKAVYPYHYRGRDNGTQDPMEFASLLSDAIEVKMGGWYG